ncbi:MAG: aminopeptidase P family protein [Rhodovibrionaceae bacterium]|nr:aminopeptidase P family protein [Rhodovibrionaceae bacterium]
MQDSTLERLLQENRSPYDSRALRHLVAGVAAAPKPLRDAETWMKLVADKPDRALADALADLKREAEQADRGLDPDAPRGPRLDALRAELRRLGADGFVIPRADEHQGEYVPLRAMRLAWLTGFTGSAGQAVVLADKAAVFVDGRYTLQVASETDAALFARRHLTEEPPDEWIAENLPHGGRLGYDPWLHTRDQVRRLEAAAARAGGTAVALEENPLDAVWPDQPPAPLAPVAPHPLEMAGRSSGDKRDQVAEALKKEGAQAVVLSLADSIAWLLNVRGGDVAHTPLPLSFALLRADGTADWFVDRRKLLPGLAEWLGKDVVIRSPEELDTALDELGGARAKVMADPASAPAQVIRRLAEAGAQLVEKPDPCLLPKAMKTAVEVDGARAAHLRDGAAVSRFLAWLDREAPRRAQAAGNGGNEAPLSEMEAAERLLAFRAENPELRDISFDTISGAGPNGAIVHYRVSERSSRALGLGELYLVDSGGQYPDGTTDITRTLPIGEPTAEMRARYTRVLKGHIALATARFPEGTTGSQLDTLARRPLWEAGLDYDHGTGHGVGSFLCVHEGPQRISKAPNRIALKPGMIVSNEPGYYKADAYGIRIENLVTVVPAERQPDEDREMLAFETLTLAPIDMRLVEPELLTAEETDWLNAYHQRVRQALTPLLDAETAAWLEQATVPLDEACSRHAGG